MSNGRTDETTGRNSGRHVTLSTRARSNCFNMYNSITEVGVTGYCSSAAVEKGAASVILRGGQNTLIASLWRSSCGVKSGHQFRWSGLRKYVYLGPFYVHRNTLSINLSSGSTVD
jgi:hypothetical protein